MPMPNNSKEFPLTFKPFEENGNDFSALFNKMLKKVATDFKSGVFIAQIAFLLDFFNSKVTDEELVERYGTKNKEHYYALALTSAGDENISVTFNPTKIQVEVRDAISKESFECAKNPASFEILVRDFMTNKFNALLHTIDTNVNYLHPFSKASKKIIQKAIGGEYPAHTFDVREFLQETIDILHNQVKTQIF